MRFVPGDVFWKRLVAALLFFAALSAAGNNEGLRLPVASTTTITRGKDQAVVHYPFGRVELPLESLEKGAKAAPPEKGALHAQTHGHFTLSYELARDGEALKARKIRVRVENREEYRSPPTPKLREHEAMHRRINTAEADRIERSLADFRAEGVSLGEAERRLKALFQEEIAAVRKLHAAWDENDIFLAPVPEGRTADQPAEEGSGRANRR